MHIDLLNGMHGPAEARRNKACRLPKDLHFGNDTFIQALIIVIDFNSDRYFAKILRI